MISAMQFIYQAAKRTPIVTTPSRKDVIYAFPDNIPPCQDKKCWLCGGDTNGKGLPIKQVIKTTFTNHDIAKAPWSNSVCEACYWGLSYSSLRNYSILATLNGLYHPSKRQIRDLLIKPPEPPFVLTIAVSGQKWLHILAKVNYTNKVFEVMYENIPIKVNPSKFKDIVELVEELYRAGFTKEEILTGEYQAHKIQAFGIERLEEIEFLLELERNGRLFELAVDLARKEEK